MIYLVHGDDYSKSRKLIINQQRKYDIGAKVERDIEDITPRELYEDVASFDLFGNAPFVVLKIPNTKVADVAKFIDVLKKAPEETVLIILAEKELGKTNAFLKEAPNYKAKVALNNKASASNIFNFVDQLFYKNKKRAYQELSVLLDEDADPFYIFSMIFYGMRNLVHAKFNSDEFSKKSSFVQSKALKQAQAFSEEQILDLYDFVYSVEKKLKTGEIHQDMAITYTIEKVANY